MSRILVVDDEVVISMQVEERLKSMGYNVVGRASSGREAVEKARDLIPDLVLMDIVMPGSMDGIEASRTIKKDLDIPIIFLTAFADDVNIMRAKVTEPFGYIVKPFEDREVKAAIEVALYNKNVSSKLRRSEQKYRTIMETASDPILIFDVENMDVLEVNKKAVELFGIDYYQFIGTNVLHLFPDGKVKEGKNVLTKLVKDKETIFGNIFILNGAGEEIPVEVSACVANLNDRAIVIATLRDVTKRKLDDWERKILEELRRSLEKAKRLSGIIPICASCKKIRDKGGRWVQLEAYIQENSEADFSHGVCPDCKGSFFADDNKGENSGH